MASKLFVCLSVIAFAAVAFASENERVKKAVIIGGPVDAAAYPGAFGYAHGYASPYSHAYSSHPYALARGHATPYSHAYNSHPYAFSAYNSHTHGYTHPLASYGKSVYNHNGYHPYSSWNGLNHGHYNNYYRSAYPHVY